MLRLLLLRHAKSSWDHPELSDHERPLNKRGTRGAGIIGKYLAKHDLVPEQVMCSDSVRTRATFALVSAELPNSTLKASFHNELYLADPAELLDHIRHAERSTHTLLVIGHNPGLHALSLALVGRGNKKMLREMAMKFPTAALSVISFDLTRWAEIRPAKGELTTFVTPRDLE